MTKEDLRLEILKLTYTHGRESSQAIERARELENYLTEKPAVVEAPKENLTKVIPPKGKPGRPKKVDNSDLLS